MEAEEAVGAAVVAGEEEAPSAVEVIEAVVAVVLAVEDLHGMIVMGAVAEGEEEVVAISVVTAMEEAVDETVMVVEAEAEVVVEDLDIDHARLFKGRAINNFIHKYCTKLFTFM